MTRPQRWAAIAGGGTAGHVLPALAIGAELVNRGLSQDQVLFVGSSRGLEARLVPGTGFPTLLLGGRGIERKLSLQNFASLVGLVGAAVSTFAEFVRHRPAIVTSVGGYASSPAVVAAVLLRIPLVVVEQNARAGVANRIASRFAKACAVAFDQTGLPRAVLTGNPVRSTLLDVAQLDSEARCKDARRQLDIPANVKVVTIFGGSLGARRINDAVVDLISIWSDRHDVFVYHITGKRDAKKIAEATHTIHTSLDPKFSLLYRLVAYEDRMDLVYAATDVCVCRAGATSIADLAIMGIPSVLIPLPTAAEDHQTQNAQGVVANGGAILIDDARLSGALLAEKLGEILDSPTIRASMKTGQLQRSRPLAAVEIVDMLVTHSARPIPKSPTHI